MLKEDYERERVRWEKKLEEAEQKLTEAAVHNSELFQLKAELVRGWGGEEQKVIDGQLIAGNSESEDHRFREEPKAVD